MMLASPPASAGEAPNVILILADDLGWSDLGCYGNPWFETPHLDRLARDGMRFTAAYAPAPICSASRAATLTGRTTARNGFEFVTKSKPGRQDFGAPLATPPFTLNLKLDLRTLPEVLGDAGYATAFFGKWHLNPHHGRYLGWSPTHGPSRHGFETAQEDFGAHPYSYWKRKEARTFLDLREGDLPIDSMNDRAVSYIQRQKEQPFFLMVSHFHVHTPVHTRARWLYERVLDRIPAAQPRRKELAHYGAMVATLDRLVGDVVAAVDEAGLAEETLILFTSDNGGHPEYAGNAPLRGSKWNLYEGGIRVPMMARWPETIPAGTVSERPVVGYDLLPTFAELAEQSTPERIDGLSFANTLLDPVNSGGERPIYWHFPYYHPERGFEEAADGIGIGIDDGVTSKTRPQSALRQGPWKLIHFWEDGRDELYHLGDDPREQRDRSGERPGLTNELRGQMAAYFDEVNARMPQ